MKKLPFFFGLLMIVLMGGGGARAQELLEVELVASEAAVASESDRVNLVPEETRQTIQETKDQDLTETISTKTDDLTLLVEEQELGPLSWHNFLRHQIRTAISHGLPTNIIVILLIFPLVAAIIAFSRHVIGLKGFGIYAPAVLSVVFVSTGVRLGILLFIVVIGCAMLMRALIKRFSLPHLPKTALILWGVSTLVLVILLVAANFSWDMLLKLGIFPLLVIILLSENFMSTELFSSQTQALKLTVETVTMAAVCAMLISSNYLQSIVILNPELTLITTCLIDVLIGRFTGLRLLEYVRFHKLMKKD
ncbi:hypothetical protein FWH30_03365 [Microgenomates group bacterium]|nr:hypothetical protein [Microgenomates group bacterium]